jgi:hypothetical protein
MADDQKIRVTSYNQSGGITAHTVNVGPQARHLDADGQSQLRKNLPSGASVQIDAAMGDQESYQFASEIKAFLISAGYKVKGVNQCVWNKPVIGQFIEPYGDGFRVVIGGRG